MAGSRAHLDPIIPPPGGAASWREFVEERRKARVESATFPGKGKGLLIIDLQPYFGPSEQLVQGIRLLSDQYDVVAHTRTTIERVPGDENTGALGVVRGCRIWPVLKAPALPKSSPQAQPCISKGDLIEKTGAGLPPSSNILLAKCGIWHLVGMNPQSLMLAAAFSVFDAGSRAIILKEFCESTTGLNAHDLIF